MFVIEDDVCILGRIIDVGIELVFCRRVKRIGNGFVWWNGLRELKYGGFIGCEIKEGMVLEYV